LEPGCSVLLNHKVHAIVGVLSDDTDPMVTVMKLEKAPQETYADIGGLDTQIQEIKESVELPLTHPEYYEEMGIKPPKGVILYGAPGTGKTLLAKAVANQTSATFLRVVGSELIQKYLVSWITSSKKENSFFLLLFLTRVMVLNWYENFFE
jgi:26S proteasome regulatory subunit T2